LWRSDWIWFVKNKLKVEHVEVNWCVRARVCGRATKIQCFRTRREWDIISPLKILSHRTQVVSFIHPTFYWFIRDVRLNHSHLKPNNISIKCEFPPSITWSNSRSPTKWNQDSDTTCWGVICHKSINKSMFQDRERWRRSISTQNHKASSIWVTTLIYLIFYTWRLLFWHSLCFSNTSKWPKNPAAVNCRRVF